MANPAFGSRPYNPARVGGPSTAQQNTFGGGPAAFSSAATTTQHREAQRLEREREERAQRERVENMQRNQYAGELSEEHREEIHDAFILFDLDHDNHIDYHELKVAMKALGFDLPKAEILAILQAHGVPASSVIPNTNPVAQQQAQKEPVGFTGKNRLLLPLAAFQTEMAGRILSRDPKEEILRAFDLFDEGRKGKINLADLRRVAQELGESLQEEELNAMIDEFDMDGDGEISREEFLGICLG